MKINTIVVVHPRAGLIQVSAPPPLGLLDMGVVESLPPEFFSELNEIYGGKLVDFISRSKVKSENSCGFPFSASHEQVQGTINVGEGLLRPDVASKSTVLLEKKHADEQSTSIFRSRSHNEAINNTACENADLLPSSLSQVDPLVLQQLPEDLRIDILEQIPAHRRQDLTSNADFGSLEENPQKLLDIKISEFQLPQIGNVTKNNLWLGNPPQWVDRFKASNCLMLNSLALMYYKSGSCGNLSSILQSATTEWQCYLDGGHDDWSDEATYYLCELFKQYIKLKIEFDIEELYVCFRLLKRFMAKSKFFSQVYNNVFPHLQASVGEVYGGNLNVSLND
uniref:DNA repair protein REV1 isoform X1 n=1 Tax=Rhizophora mucronata TaxID=61149 RepID=A0A2P2KC89_RHIMU